VAAVLERLDKDKNASVTTDKKKEKSLAPR